MPNRILREGILTSPRVARLGGWADEVFYRRLMSIVDDFGRYYADPGLLRAACYPRQLNKVSDSDIGKWLTACVNAALVRVYPASDGESYLQLIDFRQQARATKSKFPGPPSECAADATQTLREGSADAPVFGDVFVSGGECGATPAAPPPPSPRSTPRKAKTGMPEGFGISEVVKAWAAEKGFDRLHDQLEAFRRKVAAHSYTYSDWDAALQTAIADDWAKVRTPQRGGHAANDQPVTVPSQEAAKLKAKNAADDALIAAQDPEERARRIAEAKAFSTKPRGAAA